MVIGRRCDKPMAEKKGLLPCKKRCRTCVACIHISDDGRDFHTPTFRDGGDPVLQARNLAIRSYYGDY